MQDLHQLPVPFKFGFLCCRANPVRAFDRHTLHCFRISVFQTPDDIIFIRNRQHVLQLCHMRVIILLLRDSPAGSQHEISVLVPVVNGRHQTQDDLKTHRMPKRQKCAGGKKRRCVGSGASLAVNGQDPMGKRRLPVRCFCKLLNAGELPWFKCHNIRNRRRQSFFQITNRLQSRSLFHIIQIHGLKKHAGVSLLFRTGYQVAVITVTHRL